ncbi:hypothetical protein [Verticiella sediminum]|uniref:hypothetical protein n=1 Tax=Verticiella sediminum TaxID=1247510 RepID=UPI00147960E7|nr:hypothetical protein [Verticiella sediminum]
MMSIDKTYFDQRVGEQLLTHFARRNEVRRTTPLFPFNLFDAMRSEKHPAQAGAEPSRA